MRITEANWFWISCVNEVGATIDYMATDVGSNVAFTGPTFSGGVFGEGVGGAVKKEDGDILQMWNIRLVWNIIQV